MNAKKIIGINLASIVILGGATIGGSCWYNDATQYVATNNANVTGTLITVSAPQTGKIQSWTAKTGTSYQKNKILGQIQTATPSKSIVTPITMPTKATLVQESVYPGERVSAGTPLAYGYNLNRLYVQANIKETKIRDVQIGDKVDIHVDENPHYNYTGTVTQIGKATLSTFSLLPQNNDTGNFTKVTQVVPVEIQIDNNIQSLSPGLSAEVRIHRN